MTFKILGDRDVLGMMMMRDLDLISERGFDETAVSSSYLFHSGKMT